MKTIACSKENKNVTTSWGPGWSVSCLWDTGGKVLGGDTLRQTLNLCSVKEKKYSVWLGHIMPLDELADFTTKGAKPVVCQWCHESFESGTELFFMHNRKGDGPGKHICAGCCQHYLRKTMAIQHTGQLSYTICLPSWLRTYAGLGAGHKSNQQQNTREHQMTNVSTQKAVAATQRQGMGLVSSYNYCESWKLAHLAGYSHPLHVSTHIRHDSATPAQLTQQSLPWPKHNDGLQSENQVNQIMLQGGFWPIVVPKFVSNHEIWPDYSYQEAHKMYDEMCQSFAWKVSLMHQNEVVVIKVIMMLLKPGYKNPQIVSVWS